MTAYDYIELNCQYIAIFTNLDKEENVEIHRRNLNREDKERFTKFCVFNRANALPPKHYL